MWLDVMLELSYLAFQTDTTRIITFEWAREAGGWGELGEDHHELSHHSGDAGMLAKLAVIDRFHVGKLARFLGMLKATREEDGNMLDNTMVLYGSGMSNGKGGGHSPKNLPVLLAGGRKRGLKHGSHLKFDIDSTPLSNVLLTMLQGDGRPAENLYGQLRSNSGSAGVVNALRAAGGAGAARCAGVFGPAAREGMAQRARAVLIGTIHVTTRFDETLCFGEVSFRTGEIELQRCSVHL